MPRRPSPAIELTSSHVPNSRPVVPRAVTTPMGVAFSFFLMSLGPPATSLPDCGDDWAGADAAALVEPVPLSAGVAAVASGVDDEDEDDEPPSEPVAPLVDDELSEPVNPAELEAADEEDDDDPESELLPPLSVAPSLADWARVSPKM